MTDLSPAARAVLDSLCMDQLNGPQQLMARAYAAATIHALANHQPAPIQPGEPIDHWFPDQRSRQELTNLARELEGLE